jgi:hypothetical protein
LVEGGLATTSVVGVSVSMPPDWLHAKTLICTLIGRLASSLLRLRTAEASGAISSRPVGATLSEAACERPAHSNRTAVAPMHESMDRMIVLVLVSMVSTLW